MTKFRSAVIGCGMIGSRFADDLKIKGVYSHAGAYDACPATTLVALCDPDEIAFKQCTQRWGVANAYSEVSEQLNEETPELASICTQSNFFMALTNYGASTVLVRHPLLGGV